MAGQRQSGETAEVSAAFEQMLVAALRQCVDAGHLAPGDWFGPDESPFPDHEARVKRRIAAGQSGAKIEEGRYLLTAEAIVEELEHAG